MNDGKYLQECVQTITKWPYLWQYWLCEFKLLCTVKFQFNSCNTIFTKMFFFSVRKANWKIQHLCGGLSYLHAFLHVHAMLYPSACINDSAVAPDNMTGSITVSFDFLRKTLNVDTAYRSKTPQPIVKFHYMPNNECDRLMDGVPCIGTTGWGTTWRLSFCDSSSGRNRLSAKLGHCFN